MDNLPKLWFRKGYIFWRIQSPLSIMYNNSRNCIPHFHHQLAAPLLHQLVQDFLLKHHQTEEARSAVHNYKHGLSMLLSHKVSETSDKFIIPCNIILFWWTPDIPAQNNHQHSGEEFTSLLGTLPLKLET